MRSSNRRVVAVAGALACLATLAACQDQRNDFNPVRVLCPGNFDPRYNRCVIPTGEPARRADFTNTGSTDAPPAP